MRHRPPCFLGLVFLGIISVVACEKPAQEGPSTPEPPSAVPDPSIDPTEGKADTDADQPVAGNASCCAGEECERAFYDSQKDWEAACKAAGKTLGSWCPENCGFMATSDPPECNCP